MIINKKIALTGALLALLAVAFGAFGAHGLKQLIDAKAIISFETGVRYQMYHAFAILIVSFIPSILEKYRKLIFIFFLLGVLLFSGSIYLLSLNSIISFNTSVIGFITPLGGLSFILGWFLLVVALFKIK